MNFTNKTELETHLENNGWRKIPTYEVNIRNETLTHWYKGFPEIQPSRQVNAKEEIQICVVIYCPPEAPGQEMVNIHLKAEKHDGNWINFEVYTLSLQALDPSRLQAQIDDLAAAWTAANAVEKNVHENVYQRVADWSKQSDESMRLQCGEMTAQEIRTVRAVLNSILNQSKK